MFIFLVHGNLTIHTDTVECGAHKTQTHMVSDVGKNTSDMISDGMISLIELNSSDSFMDVEWLQRPDFVFFS